ncbi:glycosyl transferase [Streptomyces atroolivaceus]|uniref:glycosyl transferase n=1 Tax=Streptomyces atroolivaceus TaxID=66869 RepID=UPI0037AB6C21
MGGVMPSEGYDHDSRGCLAGVLAEPPATGYRVRYRVLPRAARYRIGTVLLMALAPALAGALLLHVLWPTHWADHGSGQGRLMPPADSVTLVAVALLELFLLVNVIAVAHAVWVARDPVPVLPERGAGLAFLVTYVPGKERLSTVRATLEGAVRMRHPGPLDVWLLDESDDPEARMLCAELGVHHFTRLGVPEWNRTAGPHEAGTRHGNYNAWLAKHGDAYDFFASVDTGHVPLPGFLERMTGYFRDPDIAFVVGPPEPGPDSPAGTGADGSARFPFHALLQRAGNHYGAPVFAGTGRVMRVAALRRAGGFHDSAAGDLASGFEIHRRRNPLTGRHWRSVHTPDVPVAGKGPSVPAYVLTQRLRRSRGAYGALSRQYGRALFRVPPGRLIGYTLTLLRRPVAVVTCLFGALSCLLAVVHAQMRVWAVCALVATALPPALEWCRTRLRERGSSTARERSRTVRPVQEAEPALAAATTASSPVAGN